MYKSMVKKILAGLLTVCMIAGMIDLSVFTVQAAGNSFQDDGVNWVFDYPQSMEYTGGQLTPTVHIYPATNGVASGAELDPNTDYHVEYGTNQTVAQGGTIEFVGDGSYAGSRVNVSFIITKKNIGSSAITVDPIDTQIFVGTPIVPSIVVKDNGTTLNGVYEPNAVTGTDYDYTYTCSNNGTPGTANVVILGKGNYTSSKSNVTFQIVQLDPDLLTADVDNQIYDGTDKKAHPYNVKYNGTSLAEGTDYDLDWSVDTRRAGEATVSIIGKNRYAGIRKDMKYNIVKSMNRSDIIVTTTNKVYTGEPIELDESSIVVMDSDKPGQPLQFGVDYELVEYGPNIEIGQVTVKVKAKGSYYSGYKIATFEINSAQMRDLVIEVAECTYDGTFQEPAVTVKKGDITYAPANYTVVYNNNKNAGNAATVTVSGNGNLIGSPVTKNFTINRRSTNDPNVTMTLDYPVNQIYNRQPIQPRIKVEYKQGDGTTVQLGAGDYTFGYENDINASTDSNPAVAKIIGIGNFKDENTATYVIDRAPLNSVTASIGNITDPTYTGQPHEPRPPVEAYQSRLSEYNDVTGTGDYTIEWTGHTNAGQNTATIKIIGCKNYIGDISKTFSINKKNIEDANVSVARINPQTYTGKILKPGVTVMYGSNQLNEFRTDYTLSYGTESTNRDIGTQIATVTINGTGNYEGSRTVNFDITRRDIGTGDFLSLLNLQQDYSYTGAAITEPLLQVRYVNPDQDMNYSLSVGSPGTTTGADCIVTYSSNTAIGSATVRVDGIGNYSGYKIFPFKIKGNLTDSDKTEVIIPDQTYTGSVIDPQDMVVKFNGVTLQRGRDYTAASTGTEPGYGSGLVEITGINNYHKTIQKDFNIKKKNLDDVTDNSRDYVVSGINPDGYEYNGYPIEPELTVDYNGIVPPPTAPGDFWVEYTGSEKAGTATAIIHGTGSRFEGETVKEYQIHQYDIEKELSNVTLSGVVEDLVLEDINTTNGVALQDGKVVQTNLVVNYRCTNPDTGIAEDRVLVEGEDADYTVSYESNTTIGTAKVIIEGKNNFKGKIEKEFKIRGDLNANGTIQVDAIWSYVPEFEGPGNYKNTPAPVVRYNSQLLTAGTDYIVSYTDNDKVGRATVTITANPDGKYAGSLSDSFEITKRVLSLTDSELIISGLEEGGYVYDNGNPIIPDLTITYMGVELLIGDIEMLPYHNINVPEENTENRPIVIVTAKADGNYDGSIEIPFIINPRPVNPDSIRVDGIPYGRDYDGGNEIRIPDGDIKLYYGAETTPLIEGDGTTGDYKIDYSDNHEIGKATITITGRGNYRGNFEQNFYVQGVIDPNSTYMHIADIADVPYGIVAVYPKLTITDNSITGEEKILEQSIDNGVTGDFKITSCINNTNVASKDSANPPTVTIEGVGCYRGTYTGTFNIIPKDLSTDEGAITADFIGSINNTDVSNAYEYTGSEIRPDVKIYNNGAEMVSSFDYTIEGYVNNTNVPADDATEEMLPGVIIKAKENGNYVGTKIIRFNIIPKNLSYVNITFTGDSTFTYDRTKKEPGIAVTFTTTDGVIHDFPITNYKIDYENSTNAGKPTDGVNAPTVVITGQGNFTGDKRMPFTILPEPLGPANPDIIATAAPAVYNGSPVGTTVTLKAADGTGLTEGTDFTVGQCTNNINAGTDAKVTVQGTGNYTGIWQVPFTIKPRPVSDVTISAIDPKPYTAEAIQPEPVVTVNLGTEEIPNVVTLAKGNDYELTWRENTKAGTAYAVITGKNNYASNTSKEQPFTIQKKNIGINGIIESQMTLQPIGDQYYTGSQIKPGISLTYSGGITETMVEGRDYTVSCTGNTAVGTAAVTVTGTGNYEGTINTDFRILGNMAMVSVSKIEIQKYTGSGIEPSPIVTFPGRTSPLVRDKDYELIYHDNIEKGTASVEVKGIGTWFTGSKTVTFAIAGEFSSQMTIAGLAVSYTYTGKAVTPSVRVTDYGMVLTEGKDYKLNYSNNINAGTAKVTVEGMGIYTGQKSATYKIIQRNISQCTVTNIGNQNYTGKKVSPAVKITYGGKTLTSGTDYTIVYTNNVKAGRANAIIKGKGDFNGTKTVGYNIVIPKVSGVKISGYNSNSGKISWKRNNSVTGYEIYSSSNKLVTRQNRTKTSYTISKLRPGKTYTYKIRAYATKDGATKRSQFVTLRFSTAPAATAVTSISSSKSKQVVLKWKKVSGATEYLVYRSTSKSGKYTSIGTTKSTSFTDKKATSGRTYYYKIRVRRTVDKKNYYSSYSAIKSIKAKK